MLFGWSPILPKVTRSFALIPLAEKPLVKKNMTLTLRKRCRLRLCFRLGWFQSSSLRQWQYTAARICPIYGLYSGKSIMPRRSSCGNQSKRLSSLKRHVLHSKIKKESKLDTKRRGGRRDQHLPNQYFQYFSHKTTWPCGHSSRGIGQNWVHLTKISFSRRLLPAQIRPHPTISHANGYAFLRQCRSHGPWPSFSAQITSSTPQSEKLILWGSFKSFYLSVKLPSSVPYVHNWWLCRHPIRMFTSSFPEVL